jgi:hypothetical protein
VFANEENIRYCQLEASSLASSIEINEKRRRKYSV